MTRLLPCNALKPMGNIEVEQSGFHLFCSVGGFTETLSIFKTDMMLDSQQS